MKKREQKPPVWHKEWDKRFGKYLEEVMAERGETEKWKRTWNMEAKYFIEKLIEKEMKDFVQRHNLVAMGMNGEDSVLRRYEGELYRNMEKLADGYRKVATDAKKKATRLEKLSDLIILSK